MMKKNIYNFNIFYLILFVLLPLQLMAQTVTAKLAFTGYIVVDNTNAGLRNDKFSFVLLEDLPANTPIYFTDYGVKSVNPVTFQTATEAKLDGDIKWSNTALTPKGTNVTIELSATPKASVGTPTIEGKLIELGLGGDQLFAYTDSNTKVIEAALLINKTDWDTAMPTTSSSASLNPNLVTANKQQLIISNTTENAYQAYYFSTTYNSLADFNDSNKFIIKNSLITDEVTFPNPISLIGAIKPDTNNILYVNQNVVGGTGDGSSWTNAVGELADVLKWANENKADFTAANPLKIYIAKGTYKPKYSPIDGDNFTANPNDSRVKTFLMVDNVELYGGFDPVSGYAFDKRIIPDGKNEAPNGTILSGDFDDNDEIIESESTLEFKNNNENAYHVIVAANITALNTVLNGITITGGNANSNSSIIINGVSVTTNNGGGIFSSNSNAFSKLNLINSSVVGNIAVYGGGVYSTSDQLAAVNLVNSKVSQNKATIFAGGGIFIDGLYKKYTSLDLLNSSVNGNYAQEGGGIYSRAFLDVKINIVNSEIYGNKATNNGGGIYSSTSFTTNVNLVNSNFINNTGKDVIYFNNKNNRLIVYNTEVV